MLKPSTGLFIFGVQFFFILIAFIYLRVSVEPWTG